MKALCFAKNFTETLFQMSTATAEQRLQPREIQPTAMRLRVLNFMVEYRSAVSLSDLEKNFYRSDRTTLYRTLKTFQKHGMVHQINAASGIVDYCLCSEDCSCFYPVDVHLHFFCLSYELTYCFPHLDIPGFELPENFMPSHGNFVITGQCLSCPS